MIKIPISKSFRISNLGIRYYLPRSERRAFYYWGLGFSILCLGFVAYSSEAAVKAFPSAEGFGADTVGGRGGRVIEVTNLNDSGAGSLRACALSTGPRTCVFRIGGIIVLGSDIRVESGNSYLTIAGQTAPGDGVQIKDHGFTISGGGHDIIIRYLRIRPGIDANPYNINNDCNGFTAYGTYGEVYNVIVDHSSIEWVCDDSFQFYSNVTNSTLQWSMVGEGLIANDYMSATGESAHSKGVILNGVNDFLSLHHNLVVHSGSRNPSASGDSNTITTIDWRNNVTYNWNACQGNIDLGAYAPHSESPNISGPLLANFIGNKIIPGPNTNSTDCYAGNIGGNGTKIYIENNWSWYCKDGCSSLGDLGFVDQSDYATPASDSKFRSSSPFGGPPITMTPLDTLESVLAANAGANRPVRDALDTRLVNEFLARTGDLGRNGASYPNLSGGIPPSDTDHDGMPDTWESSHGLNPNNSSDGSALASNGYTNVENYLNELAGDTVPGTTPSPLQGDINGDKIVNSLDWSLMSAKWLTNDANSDLNKDGAVNSLDWSIMSGNWLKTI